jgi:hypothetical protein
VYDVKIERWRRKMTERSKLMVTPGPWDAKTDDLVPERGAVYVEGALGWDEQSICDCSYSGDVETDEANASLIAEAGTVFHETGLTPQQLREQRDELLAALKCIHDLCEDNGAHFLTRNDTTRALSRAAIAKIEQSK